jgi:hypothetical protein
MQQTENTRRRAEDRRSMSPPENSHNQGHDKKVRRKEGLMKGKLPSLCAGRATGQLQPQE